MNIQDVRKLLETTNDKLTTFSDMKILSELRISEFINVISDFLTDEEILKLFNFPHFQNFNVSVREKIIKLISDETILLEKTILI